MSWQSTINEKTSEYGPAIPKAVGNCLMELAGEGLVEYGPWLLWLLVTAFWKQLLIALGGALLVTFILAAVLGESGGNRPRSLFSYEDERSSGEQKGIQNP